MPVIAILLGIVLIDLGFRGTEHEFAQQLGKDFSGGQFWAWLAAISIIGALGYYSPIKKISDAGLALLIIGLVFSENGVFEQFANVIKSPPSPAASVPLPSVSSSSGSGLTGGSGSGGSGSLLGTAVNLGLDYETGGGAGLLGF